MKWGTMARLTKIGVMVVVALILAGPVLGMAGDLLKYGDDYEVAQIGTDAVYELRTMDEPTLRNNLVIAIEYNSGPLTVEYGDNVATLTMDQVGTLAKNIIASAVNIATVKDADGNIVKQKTLMYGNNLETGTLIDIQLGKLAQGLDLNMTIEYNAKGVVIPVEGSTESKDGCVHMDVKIPEIIEALVDALGGERTLLVNADYVSTFEVNAKLPIDRFESTYECIKIDRGFRIDVKSNNSYGEFTADIDADVDMAITSTSDGFSITFINGFSEEPISKGIEKYITGGITIKSGNHQYEMSEKIAQSFLELIKILEAEAK